MNENDHDIRKFLNSARKVRLTAGEKRAQRRAVLEFVAEHPAREGVTARLAGSQSVVAAILAYLQSPIPTFMPIALAVLLIIVAGGGASFAAEGALPGDALYPVKVSFNEEVRAVLAISPKAKAEFELERLERRLDEAERLAAMGKLESEARIEIETRFETHAERARERITSLEFDDDIEAATEIGSNLEASLRAHERILKSLSSNIASGTEREVRPILDRVKEKRGQAAEARIKVETKVRAGASADVRAAAEGRLKAAEAKIAETKKFIASAGTRLNATATTSVNLRLADAERLVAAGKIDLEAGRFADAFNRFQQAHRIAQEAKLIAEAQQSLKIRLNLPSTLRDSETEEEIEIKIDDSEDDDDSDRNGSSRGGSANVKTQIRARGNSGNNSGSGTVSGAVNAQIQIGL